jgi:hypothetical protein
VISEQIKIRLLLSQFAEISRQFRELSPRNLRAGVSTENQDDESNNNGHCLPPSLLAQAYRSFLSAGLGELVFEMFSNSVNRAFHARRGSPNRSESATNPVALRQLSGYLTGTLNVDFGGSTAKSKRSKKTQ